MKNINKYLQDMLSAIISIESYTVSSYDDFLQDVKTQDAIMFNLIILGEAANKIPREFHENFKKNTKEFRGLRSLEQEMSSCMGMTR